MGKKELTPDECVKISSGIDNIVTQYVERKKTIEQLAAEYNLSISQVRKITESVGMWHTTKRNPAQAVYFLDEYRFLL